MKKDLPIYKMSIVEDDNHDTGVEFIALVDRPAIEINWQVFNTKQRYQVQDEKRRIISGALMVADLPIYRNDNKRGEYYTMFDSETIYQIAQKYMRNGFASNVNIMHDSQMKPNDVFLFESFIIDKSRGINTPDGFEELPQGSWFGSFKVNDENTWNNLVENGVVKGFSVEGNFIMELESTPAEQALLKDLNDFLEILENEK